MKVFKIFLTIVFMIAVEAFSQAPPPPGGHGSGGNQSSGGGAPIGGGAGLLLAMAAFYGSRKIITHIKEHGQIED